jgi:hypothetical protein
VWRSWLARTAGGREVAGSSPVTPTTEKDHACVWSFSVLSANMTTWRKNPGGCPHGSATALHEYLNSHMINIQIII